jgi:acetyl/propionyl-CoA carboxylase alpha subunit
MVAAPIVDRSWVYVACVLRHVYTLKNKQKALKSIPAGWRNVEDAPDFMELKEGEATIRLGFREYEGGFFTIYAGTEIYEATVLQADGLKFFIRMGTQTRTLACLRADQLFWVHDVWLGTHIFEEILRFPEPEVLAEKGNCLSPMPGEISAVMVQPGDLVKVGDALVTLISMKMENTLYAPETGVVEEVLVVAKSRVESGQLLIKINPIE